MQGQKKVFKFTFVFVLCGLDRVAHNDAQAFQLVAGELLPSFRYPSVVDFLQFNLRAKLHHLGSGN